MTNILDHVSTKPVLEINDWSRSATRKEWFAIIRRIIKDTDALIRRSISKTYLPIDPQALSKFLVLPIQTETFHQAEQAL